MKEKKLRPVIFEKGKYVFHRQNAFQQNLLLKALSVTTNPNELKKLTGIRTVAEVYRTLDKLAIRKEYHEALVRSGLDLDFIVKGISDLCKDSSSDNVKLSGYKTLLKSLGLDEYKENAGDSGKSWEEMVREVAQEEVDTNTKEIKEYEVTIPVIPEDEKEKRRLEQEAGENLYDE